MSPIAFYIEDQQALWKNIANWAGFREAKIRLEHNGHGRKIREAIDAFHHKELQVRGIWWRDMKMPTRPNRMPAEMELEIVRFMRENDLIEGPFEERRGDLHVLWKRLQITSRDCPSVHKDFLRLCQGRVTGFIQDKGLWLRAEDICWSWGRKIRWERFTLAWLEPGWNGDTWFPDKRFPFPASNIIPTSQIAKDPNSCHAAPAFRQNRAVRPTSVSSSTQTNIPSGSSISSASELLTAAALPKKPKTARSNYDNHQEGTALPGPFRTVSPGSNIDNDVPSPKPFRIFTLSDLGDNIDNAPPLTDSTRRSDRPSSDCPPQVDSPHTNYLGEVFDSASSRLPPTTPAPPANAPASVLTNKIPPNAPPKQKGKRSMESVDPAPTPMSSQPMAKKRRAQEVIREEAEANTNTRFLSPNTFYREPSDLTTRSLRSQAPELGLVSLDMRSRSPDTKQIWTRQVKVLASDDSDGAAEDANGGNGSNTAQVVPNEFQMHLDTLNAEEARGGKVGRIKALLLQKSKGTDNLGGKPGALGCSVEDFRQERLGTPCTQLVRSFVSSIDWEELGSGRNDEELIRKPKESEAAKHLMDHPTPDRSLPVKSLRERDISKRDSGPVATPLKMRAQTVDIGEIGANRGSKFARRLNQGETIDFLSPRVTAIWHSASSPAKASPASSPSSIVSCLCFPLSKLSGSAMSASTCRFPVQAPRFGNDARSSQSPSRHDTSKPSKLSSSSPHRPIGARIGCPGSVQRGIGRRQPLLKSLLKASEPAATISTVASISSLPLMRSQNPPGSRISTASRAVTCNSRPSDPLAGAETNPACSVQKVFRGEQENEQTAQNLEDTTFTESTSAISSAILISSPSPPPSPAPALLTLPTPSRSPSQIDLTHSDHVTGSHGRCRYKKKYIDELGTMIKKLNREIIEGEKRLLDVHESATYSMFKRKILDKQSRLIDIIDLRDLAKKQRREEGKRCREKQRIREVEERTKAEEQMRRKEKKRRRREKKRKREEETSKEQERSRVDRQNGKEERRRRRQERRARPIEVIKIE
jgi:hypothetical protein